MKTTTKVDPIILHSNYEGRPFSIDVTYLPNGLPKPVILHIHGFKGFKDWGYFNLLSEYAAQRGYVFVKMNFSHNGTTPDNPLDFVDLEAFGSNNFTIEQDDMGKVIDFIFSDEFPVNKNELDLGRFFLTGHSRGGAAVVLKGYHDKRIKAISSWAGINNLASHFSTNEVEKWKEEGVVYIENSRTKQQMPLYYQMAEDYMKHKDALNIPEAIQNSRKPMLIVHGSKDPTVPVQVAYLTQKWNPDVRLYIVEDADHVFGGGHPWNRELLPDHAHDVIDKTLNFFQSI
jgi:dipeptidyl aminopeptidase/acylaminoacyl peptidase